MSRTIRDTRAAGLQGGQAGFASRVAADAIDFGVVQVIYLSILVGIGVVKFLVERKNFSAPAPDVVVTVIAQWVIIVTYLGTNWSSTGRSIGKSVLGLRVTNREGATMSPRRAFMRAALCATFWAGLLWIFVSKRNAALQDHVFSTRVIYDWRGGTEAAPGTTATS